MPNLQSVPNETHHSKPKRSQRLVPVVVVTAIGVLVIGFLWYIGVFGGNVHDVVKDRVYRSSQLTGHNLDYVFTDDHIRTDINLRGGSVKDNFYRNETAECRSRGITHIDVTLSSRHLPPPAKLDTLLTAFDHAQYPVLIHCQAGADRTGLVAALYVCAYQHVPVQQAVSEELTWRYGHFSFGEAHPMNDFFTLYEKTNGGLDMRTWILTKYPAIYAASKH